MDQPESTSNYFAADWNHVALVRVEKRSRSSIMESRSACRRNRERLAVGGRGLIGTRGSEIRRVQRVQRARNCSDFGILVEVEEEKGETRRETLASRVPASKISGGVEIRRESRYFFRVASLEGMKIDERDPIEPSSRLIIHLSHRLSR